MAAAGRPPPDREAWGLPAASWTQVPSGCTQCRQDGAELGGPPAAAGSGTWPHRADRLRPPAAKDDLAAALRGPGLSAQPAPLWGAPCVAWSEHERPAPPGKTCSHTEWTAGRAAEAGDSSVSSGCLSGSSGGHTVCAAPPGPWKERPPQVLRPPRQPRESNPRLEQLRDKIRAQAQGQASCASLGTLLPSSASHLHHASTPAPWKKAQKLKHPAPAPACQGAGTLSVAGRGAEGKASPGQGREQRGSVPQEKTTKRTKSSSSKREKAPESPTPRRAAKDQGDDKEAGAAERAPVRPRTPSPASIRSDPPVPVSMPTLASRDQPANIQSAMAVLRQLRRQIQAGLELARDHQLRGGRERGPSRLWLQDLAGRRPQGPRRAPDVWDTFAKRPLHSRTLAGARSFPAQQRSSPVARWGSCPKRAWSAQGPDSFQRPGSPPERPTYFPPRAWSVSAGRRPRATCEDWEAPAGGPWNPLERQSPRAQRSWSASFTHRAGTPCMGIGSPLLPTGVKRTWPRPAPSAPRPTAGKENEAWPPPPCPKPRGCLGPPCSSESLREFVRQKAHARRLQALQETSAERALQLQNRGPQETSAERALQLRNRGLQETSAERALQLRNRRLRDVHRHQREAVPIKAFPVVSQTSPGIVTFVPQSAESGDLDAPGSLGSPALQWNKVTSGVVLGDREAPGSFCLCLDRAPRPAETLETGALPEGWDGAPLPMSASPSLGPSKPQDPPAPSPRPGLCTYLDPEEAEQLGMPGALHLRYKRARLQALECMANVLKQRIDILTAQLLGSKVADTLGDLVSAPPPSCPGTTSVATVPVAPACPGGLVPAGGRGTPRDWADTQAGVLLPPTRLLDGERARLRSPGWEARRSASSQDHLAGRPQGFMADGRVELDKRLARCTASYQAFSRFAGSSRREPAPPDPTCGSPWLEERPASARGAGLATRWTCPSCGQWEPGGQHPGSLGDTRQRSLSFLQPLQREIRFLRNSRPFWPEGRTLLLRHHRDVLSVQRSLVRLRQQLGAPAHLPQSPGPEVKAAQEGGSEASWRPEGPAGGSSCPLTPHRPCSTASHGAWSHPQSPRALEAGTCCQDNTHGTPAQTTCPAPAAAEEAAPPSQPQRTAPGAVGSPPESAAGTCPGSPAPSRAPSSLGSLSGASLWEFQKVSAVLVQLSGSSGSLPDWEAGDPPDAGLIRAGEPSPPDSWGLPGGRGRAAWEGCGAPGLFHAPRPTSGSELSQVSSEVWDEGALAGAGGQPGSGRSLPAGGPSDLDSVRAPQMALPTLGPGTDLEASGTSGSHTGKTPAAACPALTPQTSASSDVDLPLSSPLGSSASEGAGFGGEGEAGPPWAMAGRPQGPWDADRSPSTDWKPLQASPEPPVSLQAPPGDPRGLAALRAGSWAPGHWGSPPLAGGVRPETPSPEDEVLSYGSANLPSSTPRASPCPPPPPALPADTGATPSPLSEDFPPPPKDTLSPGGSLGPPEEDSPLSTGGWPPLSEEEPPEAVSPGPQGSEPGWPASCLWGGAGGAPEQPPALSRVASGAAESAADGTGQGDLAPASAGGPCTDVSGMERPEVVELVSAQLTRRILCDTLAVLSQPVTEGLVGASRVPGPPTAAAGQSWGRRDF